MKIYEGSILTCDSQDRVCRYLVEDGGRIVYVGDELPAKFASGSRVKLGDRALIPVFGDSHIHFASFATFHAGLNVSDVKSNAEILDMIRTFVPTCTDKLIIAPLGCGEEVRHPAGAGPGLSGQAPVHGQVRRPHLRGEHEAPGHSEGESKRSPGLSRGHR